MKVKEPFFSVLIPVYNVENYLTKCLDSLLNQTFTNFEVIMLNDGSTDDSEKICLDYQDKDNRFKYIKQTNMGLLQTRRNLFKLMSGKYAVCLDSDDYKPLDSLKYCYLLIEKYNCDLLIGRYSIIEDNGTIKSESAEIFPDLTLFTEKDIEIVIEKFILSGLINSLALKVISSEIIDYNTDYSKYKDLKGEDLLQSINLFKNAKKVLFTSKLIYYYRMSINSRTNNFKIKYIKDINTNYDELMKLYIEKIGKEKLNKFYHRFLMNQKYNIYLIYKQKMNNIDELLNIMQTSNVIKNLEIYIKNKKHIYCIDKILFYCINGKNKYAFCFFMETYSWIKKIKF